MAELTRRGFLKLMGAAVTLSAGGIALLEREPIRTFFLPPRGGWPGVAGEWELALAKDALDACMMQLATFGTSAMHIKYDDVARVVLVTAADERRLASLALRRDRLVERVDKLARGWKGFSARYVPLPDGRTLTIHGGRSSG